MLQNLNLFYKPLNGTNLNKLSLYVALLIVKLFQHERGKY